MSSNEKTVGKGGRKKDSSDKTRVNTFIFSLEPERQYFCSCWNVSCLRQDFSCRIFCEKRNNKDIGLALGTSNPQVEVPMCFCLLLRFKVREMQDSFFQFLSLLFCIENKWTNKKKNPWTLEITSLIRLFMPFPGVPAAPVGTVPLNPFLKWSLNLKEMIKDRFQHPLRHSGAGSPPCHVPALTPDLQGRGIISLDVGHSPWNCRNGIFSE